MPDAAMALPLPMPRAAPVRDARDQRLGALMEAAQAGDAAAYQALLRECLPILRALCRTRLREPAEVEDAVGDALLTLHRIRHTYDPARPFGPWLAAIALRRAADRGRRLGRAGRREAPLDAAAEAPDAAPDAAAALEAGRAGAALRAAVAALPPAQRAAIGLTKLEELSLAEASRRSGMTPGALKVATHRAMAALRRRLGLGGPA
ncbi:sigma-70 family RNA polymerase sigma factor [Roseococcus sp. DSY-14]|uniref:sigma-70 family RNA polymerase sigma factor n=1 Tax=Roseococcus sp. DSY-14 TaxID=3369650 RepID=UPI00387AEF55